MGNISLIPPKHQVRMFTVKLDTPIYTHLENLSHSRQYPDTPNEVARIIFEQWARDSEIDFFNCYNLSLRDAQMKGYYSKEKIQIKRSDTKFDHVTFGLKGLQRYLLEYLPKTEPTMHVRNPHFMPNEYYQRLPEDIIKQIITELAPSLDEQAHSYERLDDDDKDAGEEWKLLK